MSCYGQKWGAVSQNPIEPKNCNGEDIFTNREINVI